MSVFSAVCATNGKVSVYILSWRSLSLRQDMRVNPPEQEKDVSKNLTTLFLLSLSRSERENTQTLPEVMKLGLKQPSI